MSCNEFQRLAYYVVSRVSPSVNFVDNEFSERKSSEDFRGFSDHFPKMFRGFLTDFRRMFPHFI